MKCPVCDGDTKIVDVRTSKKYVKGNSVFRRRECQECLTRFNSYEYINMDSLPLYIKQKLAN